MARAETEPTEQVGSELARAVRSLRSDGIPHETARQLLAYDRAGHTTLVGIDYAGRKAVLYHEVDRYVISVRFGPETGGQRGEGFA